MIPSRETWGPVAAGLEEAERRVRIRALQKNARQLIGPRGAELCRRLAQAETDPAALEPTLCAFDALAANDRRQILASYAAQARAA